MASWLVRSSLERVVRVQASVTVLCSWARHLTLTVPLSPPRSISIKQLGILPMNTTQCPRPGLEPGLLDPESSSLAMRPPRLQRAIHVAVKKRLQVVMSFDIKLSKVFFLTCNNGFLLGRNYFCQVIWLFPDVFHVILVVLLHSSNGKAGSIETVKKNAGQNEVYRYGYILTKANNRLINKDANFPLAIFRSLKCRYQVYPGQYLSSQVSITKGGSTGVGTY